MMETPDDKTDLQSSLQDGYSRLDETAKRLSEEASDATETVAEHAEGYVHQGMASLNKAGNAVAGVIRDRPFSALLVAGIGGALAALARSHR
jgi:ElaB/YqjD/DUF883 family membrane-anchored ribosome-binding protein